MLPTQAQAQAQGEEDSGQAGDLVGPGDNMAV